VLVSHDRHLLRATTDALLIVRGGRVQPFDGDLDDYRDALLGAKRTPPAPAAPKVAAPKTPPSRKNLQSRIKKLEEAMTRLNETMAGVEARLADPRFYEDAGGAQGLLAEQARIRAELARVEEEWLARQTELES
jgi:ATP-binding cassette, subfamily F, member 3